MIVSPVGYRRDSANSGASVVILTGRKANDKVGSSVGLWAVF